MSGVIPVAQLLIGCVPGRYDDAPALPIVCAPCLLSYGSPQTLHRQGMSLRAQSPLPVAAPTLHAAAIAVHRRNPAPDPVGNTARHTVQGCVALRACVFARGLACDGRAGTVGSVELIPHSVRSMRMLRHQLTLYPVFPVDREWFLCGVNCHASTFILPLVQRCLPSSLFYFQKDFDHPRGEDRSRRSTPHRNKWLSEACIACHK